MSPDEQVRSAGVTTWTNARTGDRGVMEYWTGAAIVDATAYLLCFRITIRTPWLLSANI